jgi:DNA-binding IclR family transcriptional regulator
VPGITAVGLPVVNAVGLPIAAITLASIHARMSSARVSIIVPLLRNAAVELTELLRQ